MPEREAGSTRMTERLPAAQPTEPDPQRAAYVDTLVERYFRGPIRRTHAGGEGGTRVDCSNQSRGVRVVGARGHQRGKAERTRGDR